MGIWHPCPSVCTWNRGALSASVPLASWIITCMTYCLGVFQLVCIFSYFLPCEIPLHTLSEYPHTLCCIWRKIWLNSFLRELLPNLELCFGQCESGKKRREILRKTWKGLWDWQGDRETTASSLEHVLAPGNILCQMLEPLDAFLSAVYIEQIAIVYSSSFGERWRKSMVVIKASVGTT